MAGITIVTPAKAGTRTGNRHTAQRWAALLRGLGHRVSVAVQWRGEACDVLLALHARRSHASILDYRRKFPAKPLVVVLTGTDLYRDLPASAEARRSLELADRIVVLQTEARRELPLKQRRKTRVVFQSSDTTLRHAPPEHRFRVAVVGHLREEKDPFRTAMALPFLQKMRNLEVRQIGDALSRDFSMQAVQIMAREPRYRWLGGRSHAGALGWIARSHLLVVSSVMEGGANVICEAARIGTPVLASRIAGNVGMLGRGYPGFYPLGDERALARLIERSVKEKNYIERLKRALSARRRLFAPRAEQRALGSVLRELLPAP